MTDMVTEREIPESPESLVGDLTQAEKSTWNVLTTRLPNSLRSRYEGVYENLQGAIGWVKSAKPILLFSEIALASQLLIACAPKSIVNPDTSPQKNNTIEVQPRDSRQEPDQILSNAFDEYNNMRSAHPEMNLKNLVYQRPINFMSVGGILTKFPTIDGMEANDVPQSSFLKFSVEDINGPKSLIELDPGTGIVDTIVDGIKNKFGADPYANPQILDNPAVTNYIDTSISQWFGETQNYILEIKKTRKATVNDLLLNFLIKNNGDIMRSLWDTTLFLKISARNNPADLSFGPKLENVKFLARNIQDDFSEEPLSTVLKKKIDPYSPNGIIPRSGILYHTVNIMALEGCMDSSLVNLALQDYYLGKKQNEGQAIKMSADIRVLGFGPEITQVLNIYAP